MPSPITKIENLNDWAERYSTGTETLVHIARLANCNKGVLRRAFIRKGVELRPNGFAIKNVKIGERFGCWKVINTKIRRHKRNKRTGLFCECCFCGNRRVVDWYILRDGNSSRCKKCKNELRRTGTLAIGKKKRCCRCLMTKHISEFSRSSITKDRLSPQCFRCRKDAYLNNKFGISVEEYEALADEQHSRCAICGVHTTEAGGRCRKGSNGVLVVDHCHTTGKVRGLLCSNCNTALGLFHEDPSIFNKASRYLTPNTNKG